MNQQLLTNPAPVVTPGAPRGLLDFDLFGVPAIRAVMQIGGAGGAVLLAGPYVRGFSPVAQIALLVTLAACGSYFMYLVYEAIGPALIDLMNTIVPFSFA